MQDHSTLLNSTLSDGVGLRSQTNATCCAVRTLIVEIRDLGRITISKFRANYPLALPDRWLTVRARVQQCWSARPNECNFVVHPWEQKKCRTMLYQVFDGNQTSFNIIKHDATWVLLPLSNLQNELLEYLLKSLYEYLENQTLVR